tara:strand:+ start:1590 stop:1871 length:282 start_codon:yes stop_codon:yes gene_type:complete
VRQVLTLFLVRLLPLAVEVVVEMEVLLQLVDREEVAVEPILVMPLVLLEQQDKVMLGVTVQPMHSVEVVVEQVLLVQIVQVLLAEPQGMVEQD